MVVKRDRIWLIAAMQDENEKSAHVGFQHTRGAGLRANTNIDTGRYENGHYEPCDSEARDLASSNRHGAPFVLVSGLQGLGVSASDRHQPLQLLARVPDDDDLRKPGGLASSAP
jgi:hypothetical protein